MKHLLNGVAIAAALALATPAFAQAPAPAPMTPAAPKAPAAAPAAKPMAKPMMHRPMRGHPMHMRHRWHHRGGPGPSASAAEQLNAEELARIQGGGMAPPPPPPPPMGPETGPRPSGH